MNAQYPAALAQTAFRLLLVTLLLAVFVPAALAVSLPPDDYIGDASIYAGVPSERPKPNILFVIDTSRATLNPAPGEAYDPNINYAGTYVADRIYYSDQQGDFNVSRSLGGNNPVTVGQVSCVVKDNNNAILLDIRSMLAAYGTYSGSGSDISPNLSTTGGCATAPSGVVYATGRYLNYASSQSTQLGASCDNRTIVIKYKTWPSGLPKKYKLIANILGSSVASQEPGVGSDWQQYWSLLPETDPTPVTYQLDKFNKNLILGAVKDGWAINIISLSKTATFSCTVDGVVKTQATAIGYYSWDLYYALTATVPNTQRQAFFEALKPVIQGASSAVNFGFLTYNPNNQGAVIGKDILTDAQSNDPAQIMDLINKLPSMANCTRDPVNPSQWKCDGVSAVITSGPNRPQSEALYDAGFYFGATYEKTDGTAPNKQSINLTTHVPNPNLCGYNHIIFLTNGLPNKDTNTPDLGDWDGDNYGDETVYGLGTHLLDDVAAYLQNEVDLRANPDGTKGGGITTHVILAFQAEDRLLRSTANAGGGEFYNVFNTEGLANALLSILANIVREADTSFVAPVVPASSTNRTRSGERVYLGLFKPQTNANWHGNLKKYKLSSTNDLLDKFGNTATNAAGDFIPATQSFWGTGPVSEVDPTIVLRGADGNRDTLATGGTNAGDGGFVNVGGVGGTLIARADLRTRNIFTIVNGIKTSLWDAAATPKYRLNPQQLGLSDDAVFSAEENLKRSQLIDFLYGFDSYGFTYTTEGQVVPKRNWILGDILHSKPLVRAYWPFALENEETCQENLPAATGDADAPYNSTMIYVGTNDGMMHAFRDCDGSEAWAFVPPILLDKLQHLPDGTHEFYVDASPISYVYDADNDGRIEDGDKVFLVFGMRRGGGISYLTPSDPRGAYYILEVTDPENPQYRGEVSINNPSYGELGETWSQPVIDWIKDGTTAKLAMFIGAGYDNNEDLRWGNTQTFPLATWSNDGIFTNDTDTTVPTNDGDYNNGNGVTSAGTELTGRLNPKGRGIYIVELARIVQIGSTYALSTSNSGELIWSFTNANTAGMNYSFPNDLTVLDWEGSDFVDRIYAADTGGQLWRIDVKDIDPTTPSNDKNDWSAHVIFNANAGAADASVGRKFFYRPDVGKDGADAIVLIGSGDREHPLNRAVKDRLYMIRDKGQTSAVTEAQLKDLTTNRLQESTNLAEVEAILTELNSASNYGWLVRLEGVGEKMLAEPVLFFGDVLYTTYTPLPPVQDTCEVGNLGEALLYHVDSRNATAVVNYCNAGTDGWERCLTDNDSEYNSLAESSLARGNEGEVLKKADRVVRLGEGIPSGIVPLIDKTGKVSLKIAASGRLTDVKGEKINTYYPLYWTETILK